MCETESYAINFYCHQGSLDRLPSYSDERFSDEQSACRMESEDGPGISPKRTVPESLVVNWLLFWLNSN